MIEIRRVARVSAGGKRFNFSVAMIIGDRNGSVGVGTGKGADTSLAIDKAMRDAKKNMITVAFTKTKSIAHPSEAKYSSARISITPAPGRGVAAGSSARGVIELVGLTDITAKLYSPSKNGLNIARATIEALRKLPGTKMKSHSVVVNKTQ
jgi:small subunit ribosomal protein S5